MYLHVVEGLLLDADVTSPGTADQIGLLVAYMHVSKWSNQGKDQINVWISIF